MTNTEQTPVSCTSRVHTSWTLYSLEGEAQLEALDREAGREYVPMNVFVDPWAVKRHFQDSAVRVRWSRSDAASVH